MPRAQLPVSKRHQPHAKGQPGNTFTPTDTHRRTIEKLAPILKVEEICAIIGISIPTMYKYFTENLNIGRAMANAIVGQTAFNLAAKGNVPMVKHWTETRMGWVIPKDAVQPPEDGIDLAKQTSVQLEAEAAELVKRRLALAAPDEDDDEQEYHATNNDRFGEAGSHGAEAAD